MRSATVVGMLSIERRDFVFPFSVQCSVQYCPPTHFNKKCAINIGQKGVAKVSRGTSEEHVFFEGLCVKKTSELFDNASTNPSRSLYRATKRTYAHASSSQTQQQVNPVCIELELKKNTHTHRESLRLAKPALPKWNVVQDDTTTNEDGYRRARKRALLPSHRREHPRS